MVCCRTACRVLGRRGWRRLCCRTASKELGGRVLGRRGRRRFVVGPPIGSWAVGCWVVGIRMTWLSENNFVRFKVEATASKYAQTRVVGFFLEQFGKGVSLLIDVEGKRLRSFAILLGCLRAGKTELDAVIGK
ncbi:hypothetical protein Tco_0782920 [Tanacetum coccineum]